MFVCVFHRCRLQLLICKPVNCRVALLSIGGNNAHNDGVCANYILQWELNRFKLTNLLCWEKGRIKFYCKTTRRLPFHPTGERWMVVPWVSMLTGKICHCHQPYVTQPNFSRMRPECLAKGVNFFSITSRSDGRILWQIFSRMCALFCSLAKKTPQLSTPET